MREILFRGKCTDTGKWYEGQYIHLHKTTYCFKEDYDKDNDIHQIVFEKMTDWGLPNQHLRADVIPETVGQYIGLIDKKGKKIFDGDIVKLFLGDGVEVGPIRWSDIDVRYKFASPDGTAYGVDCTCVFEIVGNIHDNPELLKGGADNDRT